MKTAEQWIQIVEKSLQKAQNDFHLPVRVISAPGMNSFPFRQFLNTVGQEDDLKYLEVGTWMGATLLSMVWDNNVDAVAIDNYSEFASELTPAFETFSHVMRGCDYRFICKDWRQVTTEETGNEKDIYFYDGKHDAEDQYDAILWAVDKLAKVSLLIVDDWNLKPDVNPATRQAIKDAGIQIIREWELFTPGKYIFDAQENWWYGYFIAVIERP